MTKLHPYPEYQDSGIEWLGKIPTGWDVSKFRYCFRESAEVNGANIVGEMLSVSGYRGVELKIYDDENQKRDAEQLETYRVVRKGQLAVNTMWLNYAGLGISEFEGHMSPAYRAYWVERDVNLRYIHHLLRSHKFVDAYTSFLTGVRPNSLQMSRANLMDFPVVLPTRHEQDAIAYFIDHETARIDDLIGKQERLIKLLAERRRAIITKAVTRGLDPAAPTKPSGITWIGDVPAHWTVGPVKRFFRSLDNRRVPLSTVERAGMQGEFPYYGASGIIDHVDDFIYDEPLVLVSEDGANLLARSSAIAFVATGKYWVNNHAHILKPITDSVDFWAARIECEDLTPVITGSAQPKLTIEALMNLQIAAPTDSEETRRIQDFITQSCSSLDRLVEKAVSVIRVLKERRSALISAAVTGRIDIRQRVAS